jgi:methylthioxylose transferase
MIDVDAAPFDRFDPPAAAAWWRRLPGQVVALGVPLAAILVVNWAVRWGRRVQRDARVKLGAAPFVGAWHWRVRWAVVPAIALALAVVCFGPKLTARLRPRALVLATGAAAALFTLLLAAADGFDRLLDPVVHPTEYWANLATLPPAGTMLRRFSSIPFLLGYSVHLKGHPPGFVLVLKALAAVGLGRPWTVGALSYLGAGVAAAAVLATVRLVAGDVPARRAAPFLVVAPYAMWMGTSADAYYAGVSAAGVFLAVLALTSERGARRSVLASVAGVTFGAALLLTYGAAGFLLLPAVVVTGAAIAGRRWRALVEVAVVLGVATTTVLLVCRLAGFWWFDGLHATRTLYWWGTAQFRPPYYFALGNVAVALVAVGPAVVVAAGRLRNGRVWLVVAATVACLALADASQYSKGEVERIWLLFFPWLVPAAAGLVHARRWLAVQAAVAIGLQMALVSKW